MGLLNSMTSISVCTKHGIAKPAHLRSGTSGLTHASCLRDEPAVVKSDHMWRQDFGHRMVDRCSADDAGLGLITFVPRAHALDGVCCFCAVVGVWETPAAVAFRA